MVRTRHSGDPEDEFSRKFISLDYEKSKGISHNGQHFTSHGQGVSPSSDDAGLDNVDMFGDKLVESRLRPRTALRRAYYLDVDSSDDEIQMRIRKLSTKRFDEGIDRSRSRKEEMADEDQRFRKNSKRLPPPVKEDTMDSEASISTRRSLRQRRLIHDTLNDSFLVNNDRQEKSPLTTNKGRKNDSDEDDKEQESDDDGKEQETEDNLEFSDMYSRVKRKRVRIKRNMYGMPVNDMDSDSDQDETNCNNNKRTGNNNTTDEEDDDDEEEEDEEEENGKDNKTSVSTRSAKQNLNLRKRPTQQTVKSYSLREHKPRTVLYKAPVEEKRHKKIHGIFDVTPTKKTTNQTYQSPALRRKVMKRSAFHSSSSSTSSSDGESNDEKSFKRRKAKSMAKARSRMMPMNFSNNTPPSTIIKDRVKSGASLADVEPMNIDKNITFNSIGGLGKHIRALKEMVVFPLLYDKVFQRFKVDPPRGVLFYGPPGTGKTLVARALANECSQGDKRVAFFMRKGADCLSKWVGESERQLRLLFDQAYKFRPSIIFFDEIDGLAPVRSSRQDQIHSSIVSTLLALMDGLDSRGEIVVIGATNRIDSLDPALRRPGRFDREFLFPLPTLEARKQILKIHTSSWTPKLNDVFIGELADKCVGYCGADLKALCTEAAMLALRRRYPQIYISNEALQVDESSINISAKDFFDAINNIIPTSQRACDTPARALPRHICPLLQRQLDKVMSQLSDTFPSCLSKLSSLDAAVTSSQAQELAEAGDVWEELASDEDEDAPSIFVSPHAKSNKSKNPLSSFEGPGASHASDRFFNFTRYATSRPATFRPRILLTGEPGQGQTTYIAPSVIHKMEDLPVHVLDLPALYAVTAKTPEESCANVFHEAKRKSPSIIYLPYINQWWDVMGDTLRATLLTLIHDLNPSMPLLLLATSEQPYKDLDPMLQSLFSQYSGEVVSMTNPNSEERRIFFKDLLLHHTCKAPPQKKQAAQRMLEVLPKAPPVKPRELTEEELKQLEEKEELTLMELRIFLRDVLNKLGSDRKFSIFAKPVNIEDAPDYLDIIDNPMDLSTMMSKIDLHEYTTVHSFMDDIDLICSNALEYNPNRGTMDRVIRHRACALKDTAYAIIKTELDKDFEKMCLEIQESQKRRGVKSSTVPNYYYTKPLARVSQDAPKAPSAIPSYLHQNRPPRSIPKPEGERFSRRVRGLNTDPVPSLEDVERIGRLARSSNSPMEEVDENNLHKSEESEKSPKNKGNTGGSDTKVQSATTASKSCSSDAAKSNSGNKGLSKKRTKCIWCKPRRKRRRLMFPTAFKTSEEDGDDGISQEDEDDETEDSENPVSSFHQTLQVDVSDIAETTEELPSPTRKSSRINGCLASPDGIVTRRQSLSPRLSQTSQKKNMEKKIKSGNTEAEPHNANGSNANSSVTQSGNEALLTKESNSVDPSGSDNHFNALNKKLRDSLLQSSCSEKRSVVKRLDLDAAIVDSGAGSSLESNGDSRDSTDHKMEKHSTPRSNSETADISNNCNLLLAQQAASKLNEPSKKLEVPTDRLTSLLSHLVHRTDGYNVERLEKIYSCLSQIIYRHRHSYNRTNMVQELEDKVASLPLFCAGAHRS